MYCAKHVPARQKKQQRVARKTPPVPAVVAVANCQCSRRHSLVLAVRCCRHERRVGRAPIECQIDSSCLTIPNRIRGASASKNAAGGEQSQPDVLATPFCARETGSSGQSKYAGGTLSPVSSHLSAVSLQIIRQYPLVGACSQTATSDPPNTTPKTTKPRWTALKSSKKRFYETHHARTTIAILKAPTPLSLSLAPSCGAPCSRSYRRSRAS